jgi:beta-lactamase superfamily II metal-dependent hydrolase
MLLKLNVRTIIRNMFIFLCIFVGILPLIYHHSSEALASSKSKVQSSSDLETDRVGQPLSYWKEGTLEIHHINTGEGDAAFFIMPDGTTMLIDAGDGSEHLPRTENYKAPRRPDSSRKSGEWVGRYIVSRHPDKISPALDYVLITHFHADHFSGIKDVSRQIPINLLLDRGWPYYATAPDDEPMEEYLRFISENRNESGMVVDKFAPGRNDQITLRKSPENYPEFEIQNLSANGKAWIGREYDVRKRYTEKTEITENMASTALVLRYGDFSYFSGGDMRRDMEKTIAWITGPVDVHVANHHGSQADPFFLSILQPRVHIVDIWSTIQPRPEVFKRLSDKTIYPGPRDIFFTNGMWPGRKEHLIDRFERDIAEWYEEKVLTELASNQGHVVIRVQAGGDEYHIYVLDDTTETFTIKSVHGPYLSH